MIEILTEVEINRVLEFVPDEVKTQLQRERIVLAGGAIRDVVAGLPVKDLDIFCHSEWQAEKLALKVSTFVKRTLFAFTVPLWLPTQYVFYKDFEDARDLISQFDFRACCAGIYWEPDDFRDGVWGRWVGVAVDGFHADCLAKELHFMSQKKDEGKLTALGRSWALPRSLPSWPLSRAALFQALAVGISSRRCYRPVKVWFPAVSWPG